ncbi:glycosyl transferase family 1 [Opitutaceae bacterium TAV5]|nr:glycosyl transferase family 1 [Opitutaceae bacterium TAV5]
MNIVLWGINYAPESVGIAPFNRELCEHLSACGHRVSAVTSFPYYPHWRKEPGDRGRWHRAELIGGVDVYRCWCYVPAMATTLRRIAHELSFGLVSLLRILALPRADVYVVVSPPLGLGFFAWIATTLKRSRFVFHVQDLQPDAAVGLGMLRRGWLVRALYGLERLAYAKAAMVSGISQGMMAAFYRKGVPAEKRSLLPNWLRLAPAPASGRKNRADARRFFGVADDALLAVYAGNLGRKQGLEIVIEAAALLRTLPPAGAARVALIIAGDGAARSGIEQCLRAHPGVNVQLLPLLDDDDYGALLGAADVALITQTGGSGQFFFPSKLISVLAAGLPVVAVADEDSELAGAVRAGGFGCTVRPGHAAGLASVLRRLGESRAELDAWGAHTGWVRQFSREAILPRFQQVLLEAARVSGEKPADEPEAILPA